MSPSTFAVWRRTHLVASGLVTLIAIAHIGFTFLQYRRLSPSAVWFFGAGLGVLVVGVLNLTHIGVEPCQRPTARLVRFINWTYAVLGPVALVAVPEPQAYALVAALVVQAVVAQRTLPGLG